MKQETQPISQTPNEARLASFFEPKPTLPIKEQILAALQEQQNFKPQILNHWQIKGQPEIILVELPHSDAAASPKTNCAGKIITKIVFGENLRERETVCLSCHQPLKVNLTILKLELRLL